MKKILFIFLMLSIVGTTIYWVVISRKVNNFTPTSLISTTSKNNDIDSDTSNLSFAIIADPHMDEQSSAEIFTQTLKNIVDAKPSFVFDLGDTFMIDKLPQKTEQNIRARYVLMKSFYDQLGSIPFHMVLGNHDGEAGWDKLNTKNYRFEYFPEQKSDKNYYSFEKDNTLFIVLDPYSYTTKKPTDNGWLWTLGKTQYDWLKSTLQTSSAKYKFVFIHQLVGGDTQGRGGVELAKFYEWGGSNLDGTYGFDKERSGWGKPIHQLLVDNGVDVVFKGHDHFYSKQELDGVIYQTLPQPSHPGDKLNTTQEYGYTTGTTIGGSGYLNVNITEDDVKIDFVGTQTNGEVSSKILDSYTILN